MGRTRKALACIYTFAVVAAATQVDARKKVPPPPPPPTQKACSTGFPGAAPVIVPIAQKCPLPTHKTCWDGQVYPFEKRCALQYKPYPPGWATPATKLPARTLDNMKWVTPNADLNDENTIWRFRIAMNVAALNCQGPVWDPVAPQYSQMLTIHSARLAAANTAINNEYLAGKYGAGGIKLRDKQSTDLYNWFALPPVKRQFCDFALAKTAQAALVPVADWLPFSRTSLAEADGIFQKFYSDYAQYQLDIEEWYTLHPEDRPPPPPPPPVKKPVKKKATAKKAPVKKK